ncbi:uncharacterized protein LOC116945944 isoform X1 [Petromyzon marinus]|uniref:uncharacterized protein LOC116945944 isoform X1 n=1 Tax=Petromyzon marinus TaxID=7757 RepID=UPI003F6EA0C2
MSKRNKHALNNEEQIELLEAVKMGKLTVEEAVRMANSLAQGSKATDMVGESDVYNFNVYKYNKFRQRQKRILQVDFSEKVLCNISKGAVHKRFPFAELGSCEGQEGLRLTLYFTQHHEYELEVTSDFDKTQILRLAHLILNQNKALCQEQEVTLPGAQPPTSVRVVKEGEALLRKGGLASVKWVRVWLELSRSDLSFYPSERRQGNLGKLAALTGEAPPEVCVAPCIVHLSTPGVEAYADSLADSFCVSTNKNLYTFRLALNSAHRDDFAEERDHWVREIESVCRGYKRMSHTPTNASAPVRDDATAAAATSSTVAPPAAPPAEEGPGAPAPADPDCGDEDGGLSIPAAAGNAAPGGSSANGAPGWAAPEAPSSDDEPLSGRPAAYRSDRAPGVEPPYVRSHGDGDVGGDGAWSQTPDEPDMPLFSCLKPSEPRDVPAVVPSRAAPGLPPVAPPPPVFYTKLRADEVVRTKALHWDPVQSDRIAKSMWAQMRGDVGALDLVRLRDTFRLETLQGSIIPTSQPTAQILLNSKVAQNFCIFLRGFRVQPAQLHEQLLVLRGDLETGITDEQIAELRRFVPTAEDVEMYKPHVKRRAVLHQVDQYMLEMCSIPFLGERLELLMTVREFPGQISELKPLIAHQLSRCSQLAASKKFPCVLEYVLLVGNRLNETAGRSPIKGFCLSTLPKLMETKGQNRKYTLLCFLVEQIKIHRPDLLDFAQELQSLKSGSTASIKGLTAEMDVLKQSLVKLAQYHSNLKKSLKSESETKFLVELKVMINKFKGELNDLTTQISDLRRSYMALMVRFGEATERDSEQFFGWTTEFMDAFTAALRNGESAEKGRLFPF